MALAKRTSPTKMSRGKVATKESPGGSPKAGRRTARAHRDTTGEATQQRDRIAKTHPTRAQQSGRVPATRKDRSR